MGQSSEDRVVLGPDERGYVAIETQSGLISCLVHSGWVGCETPAANWPQHADGSQCHSVKLHADGSIDWVDGQMGNLKRTTVDHRQYRVLGWVVVAISDGLRLTNEESGRGAFVTTSAVVPF